MRKLKTEIQTIEAMIRIYCRHHHGKDLCSDCGNLLSYCLARIDKCTYGPIKPACNKCEIHCYAPKMRESIKEIMRFSGRRIIWRHPYLAVVHIIKENISNYKINQSINQSINQ